MFRCVLCFKFFANNEYLTSHYMKRHREFYEQEIRKKENSKLYAQLMSENRARTQCDQDELLLRLREEVVDKFQ